MSDIIAFPINRERESARLQAIHFDQLEIEDLAADLGTPEEWLTTAILHLKDRTCAAAGAMTGSVSVSAAAISLVLLRLEELEQGGEPWQGNAA
jgi:hypothetical protein